jgi:tetratricopeptide (TPR) repeat protein
LNRTYLDVKDQKLPPASPPVRRKPALRIRTKLIIGAIVISCLLASLAFIVLLRIIGPSEICVLHDQAGIKASVKGCLEICSPKSKRHSNEPVEPDEEYFRAMVDGRYIDAVQICTNHLRKVKYGVPGYMSRGDAYFMLGQYEAALHDYQEGIRHTSMDEDEVGNTAISERFDYDRRADAYFQLGNYREAARDYRLSLAMLGISPNPIGACLAGAAEICLSLGLDEQAAKFEKEASQHLGDRPLFPKGDL